jgi:hypothetical protein
MRAWRCPSPVKAFGALVLLSGAVPATQASAQGETKSAARAQEKQQKQRTPEEQAVKDSLDRLARARRADKRALFAATDPIAFTLIANYGALSRDRDTLSTKRFAGTMIVTDTAGAERRFPVQLRTRGHFRLMARNCRFVPIRIDFPDSGLKGTAFAGQRGIKLGTHCQSDSRYDDITRRDYLAYRLFNVLTPKSFRARLAVGTYIDSANGKKLDTRTALFIENENDVARRLGGEILELRGALFADLEPDDLLLLSVAQYMIGNTDWSLAALHNIRIVQTPRGVNIPIAYDFDFSGLADAHYSSPDPRMGIRSVRERKFRGPCRPVAEAGALAARILERRDALLAEVNAVPGMSNRDKTSARTYLEDFFFVLSNPGRLKDALVDGCERRPGM